MALRRKRKAGQSRDSKRASQVSSKLFLFYLFSRIPGPFNTRRGKVLPVVLAFPHFFFHFFSILMGPGCSSFFGANLKAWRVDACACNGHVVQSHGLDKVSSAFHVTSCSIFDYTGETDVPSIITHFYSNYFHFQHPSALMPPQNCNQIKIQ